MRAPRYLLVHHGTLRVADYPSDGVYSVLEFGSEGDAYRYLQRFARNPRAISRLEELVKDDEEEDEDEGEGAGRSRGPAQAKKRDVLAEIAEMIAEEELGVAEQVARFNPPTKLEEVGAASAEAPPPEAKKSPKKVTFIEVKVVIDDTGEPVNWVRMVIKTPDGNEDFYTTDKDGLIRIEDLDEGTTCDVRCDTKEAKRKDTLRFMSAGEAKGKKPDKKVAIKPGVTLRILTIEDHQVKTGETLGDLAKKGGVTESELNKFNFDTDDAAGVNKQMGIIVGSSKTDAGGKLVLDSADKPGIVLIQSKFEQGGLAAGKRHTFRVQPLADVRREWIIEMEHLHFHHDSAVLLADYISDDPNQTIPPGDHVTAMSVLAEVLVEARKNPTRKVLIAGHTDTSGSAEYNLPLSAQRAEMVLASLMGDRDRFVELALAKHKVEDHQLILKWIAADRGFACDPGKVDNADGPKTKAAVKEFQKQYNIAFKKAIAEDGIMGKETWGAFFDVYMDELRSVLDVDEAELAELRGNIKFVDDSKKSVGCGENFPIEKRGVDNFRSKENRRVETIFFEPDQLPVMTCHAGKCNAAVCQVHDPKIFIPTVIPVPVKPAIPKPTIKFVKIQTSEPFHPPLVKPVYHEDDDFSPRLLEKIKFHVEVGNLAPGFTGKVRVDVGRITNRPAGASPDKNDAFTLCGAIEVDVTAGADPLPVEIEWDGKATVAVAQEYSNRTTPNVNGGAAPNIPLNSIASGSELTHGLYVVDQVTLIDKKGKQKAKERPADIDFSVPHLCNLQFNGNWATDLAAFGLGVFQTELEEALRRFGGRDYQIRDATLTNRMNVRFISDATVTNAQSVRLTIGGARANGLFGSTPDGPAPLSDNLYAIFEGLGADVDIFPGTFMLFNQAAQAIGPNDTADFHATFTPLGVGAAASAAAIGVASARAISGTGVVTGAANATDKGNITLTFDNDGLASVVSTSPGAVPPARAADLQRALRRFVMMVGNTTNHEAAHAFGVVSRVRANNKITIGGVTVTSPLNGDGGAHNQVTNNTNIVDAGGTRAFSRRVETTGVQQKFSPSNTTYMRDCIPFDRKDN
ncbi:MAG TPA: OmpA family protein [Tepidisphaeraceae bacterium]|nr:OmpA family protein [Tepidisphaeraceae bacterium]